MISPELLAQPWFHGLFYGVPLLTFIMTVGAGATWWERKFAARMQNRVGPNIVGPLGVLQPLADVLKMLQKEDIVPRDADRAMFQLAPTLPAFLVLATAAVIPFAGWWDEDGLWQNGVLVADLDIGILWVLALAGLMVFPTWMAGWASNNKYALLAGMRSVAQGISYEIPLILCALVPVIATGELSIAGMVSWQAENGWIVAQGYGVGLLALIIFFLASLAEANRIPFDIPEAESELVAGVLVEYTGIKFGIFMLAEYLHTFVASALAATMFLGGAHGPMPELFGPVWMALKTGFLFVIIYWIRWSWYRFRADQLMDLCWKWLVPISLLLVMTMSLMVWSGQV
jgi:NADH-quinone oxidoreductase subunit H